MVNRPVHQLRPLQWAWIFLLAVWSSLSGHNWACCELPDFHPNSNRLPMDLPQVLFSLEVSQYYLKDKICINFITRKIRFFWYLALRSDFFGILNPEILQIGIIQIGIWTFHSELDRKIPKSWVSGYKNPEKIQSHRNLFFGIYWNLEVWRQRPKPIMKHFSQLKLTKNNFNLIKFNLKN